MIIELYFHIQNLVIRLQPLVYICRAFANCIFILVDISEGCKVRENYAGHFVIFYFLRNLFVRFCCVIIDSVDLTCNYCHSDYVTVYEIGTSWLDILLIHQYILSFSHQTNAKQMGSVIVNNKL